MSNTKYIELDLNSVSRVLDDISKLIDNSPGVENLSVCDEHLRKMRSQYAYLAKLIGDLNAEHARQSYTIIKAMPDDEWKRVARSTTLGVRYIDGQLKWLISLLDRAKSLRDLLKIGSDEYRTLISARKEEIQSQLRSSVSAKKQ